MQQRMVRRLALELMTEVVEVARAEKVKLEKVSGTLDLEWMALSPEERRLTGSPGLLARHSMLLAVGFRYRRLKSSMLGALERGRPPAVEFLNGEVVERGQQHGISTPVNASVRELVWAIARKEAAPGIPLIRELFEKTAFLRGPEQR
jgi:2-dehydropantoate 2-reductase